MSIRKEKLVLAFAMTIAPIGTHQRVIYGNHRVGLRALSPIWDGMMALLAYRIPDPEKTILWHEETDQQLLKGLAIAIQLHDAHRCSRISDEIQFHPFFTAMHDTNIINSHKTMTRQKINNMQKNSPQRWVNRLELIEHLSTIKIALLKNNTAGRNYEHAVVEKKNSITEWKDSLAKTNSTVYVLRLILQTPLSTSRNDIISSQDRLCDLLSGRNKICKDRLGYFWTISCECYHDNVHIYYMTLTLIFPATSIINQGQYLQEIKNAWSNNAYECVTQPNMGYLSHLYKNNNRKNSAKQVGDIINFADPQHADAINIMLREYYLEQRWVRINHPTKMAGRSFKKT